MKPRTSLVLFLSLALAACGGTVASVDGGATDGGRDATLTDGGRDATLTDGGCTPGSTMQVDCNTCTCDPKGGWVCTRLACRDAGPEPPTDPGSVQCGGASCKVPGNYCCDTSIVVMPGTQTCVPDTTSSCGGLRQTCNEAADCPNGEVCCVPPNANIRIALNAQCSPKGSCQDPSYFPQLCRTSAECDNAMPCVPQTCVGVTVWSCGGIDPKRCQ